MAWFAVSGKAHGDSVPIHGPKSKGQRGSVSGTRNVDNSVGVIHGVALNRAFASRTGRIEYTGAHPALTTSPILVEIS